jgi:cytidyltransferase-like protein|tara:strand:- start:820 stop:1602 length:783 start_codon:yes stop_codon:yes gene_type:complete
VFKVKIIVVSGGFDPIHSGHIEYFKAAKRLGDHLVVALNSDAWLKRKKGNFFMPFTEREIIVSNLRVVDEVIGFEDDSQGGCSLALEDVKLKYPADEIIFCNGGDRASHNIPEMAVEGITFEFSVGGDHKMNSSSSLLKDWQYTSDDRVWGKFYNLFQDSRIKVKELIIDPGKGISFQRHQKRSEVWFISKGSCLVKHSSTEPENASDVELGTDDIFHVRQGDWHQLINPSEAACHVIEIQYGESTSEDDIERLFFYEGN